MKTKAKIKTTDVADTVTNDGQTIQNEIVQELRRTNSLLTELLNRTPKRISSTDLVN